MKFNGIWNSRITRLKREDRNVKVNWPQKWLCDQNIYSFATMNMTTSQHTWEGENYYSGGVVGSSSRETSTWSAAAAERWSSPEHPAPTSLKDPLLSMSLSHLTNNSSSGGSSGDSFDAQVALIDDNYEDGGAAGAAVADHRTLAYPNLATTLTTTATTTANQSRPSTTTTTTPLDYLQELERAWNAKDTVTANALLDRLSAIPESSTIFDVKPPPSVASPTHSTTTTPKHHWDGHVLDRMEQQQRALSMYAPPSHAHEFAPNAATTTVNDSGAELERLLHQALAANDAETIALLIAMQEQQQQQQQEQQQQPAVYQPPPAVYHPPPPTLPLRPPHDSLSPPPSSSSFDCASMATFTVTSSIHGDGGGGGRSGESISLLDSSVANMSILGDEVPREPRNSSTTTTSSLVAYPNLALGGAANPVPFRRSAPAAPSFQTTSLSRLSSLSRPTRNSCSNIDVSQLTEGTTWMSLDDHGQSILEPISVATATSSQMNIPPEDSVVLQSSPLTMTESTVAVVQDHDVLVQHNDYGGYLPTQPDDEHVGNRLHHQDIASRHVDYARARSTDDQFDLYQEVVVCVLERRGRFLRPRLDHQHQPNHGTASHNCSWCIMDTAEIKDKIWSDFHQPCYVDAFNVACDVMMGRGEHCAHNTGHQRYLAKRDELGPSYLNSRDNKTKNRIAQQLVDYVYDNGGRFLAKDSSCQRYRVVDNDAALKKAKQALRESP
jgi:hypothetical protein